MGFITIFKIIWPWYNLMPVLQLHIQDNLLELEEWFIGPIVKKRSANLRILSDIEQMYVYLYKATLTIDKITKQCW